MNILDRLITWMAPQWGASRARSRAMARHYESASVGRRTDNWHRLGTDANAAAGIMALPILRAQARDLVRNNPWARHGLRRLVSNIVGWGIRPKAKGPSADRVMQAWKDWAETTQCDSAGRLNMYGIQALAMRTVVESGEILIRRRWRLPTDGLAVPMQLQVLEPDFLDTARNGIIADGGGPIIQGIEFDQIGRRVAYWLFDRHPGSVLSFGTGASSFSPISKRVDAADVIHVYDQERAGQVRGPSWFASVDVRLHDFHEFSDATLMKAKIASCMAAFVTDIGDGGPSGMPGTDSATGQPSETFEPGMIMNLPPGRTVTVANPPSATDHQSYSTCLLREIAAGLGVTYEDMTGDYSQVNYSSGRMARLGHQQDVHHWRWNMLIPQFCAPSWLWMLQALNLSGVQVGTTPAAWHPAPMPMLDVDKESTAYQRRVRNGQMTWPAMIRELGEDPDAMLDEIEEFNSEIDRRGIALDCDPRKLTSAGQAQQVGAVAASGAAPDGAAPAKPNGTVAPLDDEDGEDDTGELDDEAAA
ncbi:MAG: phage portal protein [Actinomycetota bacterium]